MSEIETVDPDLYAAAKAAAGNWQDFPNFVWERDVDVEKPEDWLLYNTSNRDSGLTVKSNEAVINKVMQPFAEGDDPDVVFERHTHWLCGHVNGFSLRVFKDGKITPAFEALDKLRKQLAKYPVLNESDLSKRRYEATLENIKENSRDLCVGLKLPDNWQEQVYNWLDDQRQQTLEDCDDRGGYPSRPDLQAAFAALKFLE